MKRTVLFAMLVLTVHCGGGAVQLSRDEFERLPHEYRQEIFDAENDLTIARNREDEAVDRKAAAERSLAELDARWKRTSQTLEAAHQDAKVPRARKVFDANVAYTAALIDVASASIHRAAVDTRLSRARLDLVRQRQAARIGKATAQSLKPLEEDVSDLEAKLKASVAVEVEERTKVQPQLTAWKLAEDEFASGTGDYDTGVWGE